jgi:hypothetical protein
MKCVDQETANRIGRVFHVAMKITRGSAEPARCSLFRLIVLGAQCDHHETSKFSVPIPKFTNICGAL